MQTYNEMEASENWRKLGYCWTGGGRHTKPLSTIEDKKWRALNSLGIDMHVIGFSPDLVPRRFFQHASFYTLPQLPVAFLRHLTIFLITPFLLTWIVWQRNLHVILSHSPYDGAVAIFVKRFLQLFGKKIVVIIGSHGDWQESLFMYRRMYFTGFYRWIMTSLADYSLRRADILRVISDSTRKQIEPWVTNKPIFQFMSFTDIDAFIKEDREVPLVDAQDVVFAGTLVPLKGVHILLEAFASILVHYPNARLWLIGSPQNEDYVRQMKVRAEQLQIAERLIWTGKVSQEELAEHMKRARVVVLPSLSEGLGKVLLEGMLCGTPAVGSHVGGIPDLIDHGMNGYLVPPEDPEALAAALLKIFANRNIEAMGERARKFAREFFSPESYIAVNKRMFESAYRLWQAEW